MNSQNYRMPCFSPAEKIIEFFVFSLRFPSFPWVPSLKGIIYIVSGFAEINDFPHKYLWSLENLSHISKPPLLTARRAVNK